MIIGGILRVFKLGSKPPWTDEFATVFYSRGDDYSQISINTIISPAELLAPLKGYPIHNLKDVAALLIQQDNHPPLYFLIANLWQKLFPLEADNYISINSIRYLSVIFSIVGIFAIYWIAKKSFKSESIAQISAALMALSPFNIYLAQEARHYSLIILVAIASFGYCLHCINCLLEKKALSYFIIFGWLSINICGLLTHYFFALTLIAQAIAFIWLLYTHKILPNKSQSLRIVSVVIGVAFFSLIWITQVLPSSYGSAMTDWIRLDYSDWSEFFFPVGQFIYALATMIFVLPVKAPVVSIIIVSGILMVIFILKLFRFWQQGISHQINNPQYQPLIFFLTRFVVIAWGLFIILTYGFGYDITRGARYHFIYFPAIILLVAIGMSHFWQRNNSQFFQSQKIFVFFSKSGSQAIALILSLSFLGSLTVINNLAYQKPYQPTPIIQQIEKDAQPALILTYHKSIVQIGEMMAIAWERYRSSSPSDISFALIPYQDNPENYHPDFEQIIAKYPNQEFKLWTLNLQEDSTPKLCETPQKTRQAGYYGYVYHCNKKATT
ncbi:glycosyltransferase family 39 protein [[Leptolyngbya] sp. PCC 7376]|uniref:glycosyltransferase family 39 protein n=1 Tax=[Leptolyngbya] sp. PCC 7376 TaxID=111781 RepID=UPI0002DD5140|nr:glycosyltransferase family 39 protein [[Leptolyngbya] sp. PCC 7376]